MKNNEKKLTKSDVRKINKRFEDVCEALMPYSLLELREIWQRTKMSSTDRTALEEVVTTKLKI